jgi:hypothetical protein
MRWHSCPGNHADAVTCIDLTPIFASSSETCTHDGSPVLTDAPYQTPCPDMSLMARWLSEPVG